MTQPQLALVWDNFGPGHDDRCRAAAEALGPGSVVGVELYGSSYQYDWDSSPNGAYDKVTVFPGHRHGQLKPWRVFWHLLRRCLQTRSPMFCFCHYERPEVFATACCLRLLGRRVVVMNDSKFDDYPRHLRREVVKAVMYTPYQGGLASGERSRDYLRFLGLPENRIFVSYNALSLDRIRRSCEAVARPPFAVRPFVVLARLVSKKNIAVALQALARHKATRPSGRKLWIIGAGPLEAELKAQAQTLHLGDDVVWFGHRPNEEACRLLKQAIALLLPSTEEQFGNVVIEAQALGVPCIVSTNVGARDVLVRNFVSGLVIEPDNVEGLAAAMHEIGRAEDDWNRYSRTALAIADRCDASAFAAAVKGLKQALEGHPA